MIGSIGNSSMISQLFSKLDTKSQGYLEKSDLVSAFSQISSGDSSSNVDQLFTALDSDSDGKVTASEFSSTLSKLQEELDSQFAQMRMQGHGGQGPQGMGGMPPPPPPANDQGFTQDELSAQLDQINSSGSSSDSERADLISTIVNNFSAADTDGNGKVSFAEAQAYKQSSDASTSSSDSTTTTASTTSSSTTDAQLMHQILQLLHAYGGLGNESSSAVSSLLSTSA